MKITDKCMKMFYQEDGNMSISIKNYAVSKEEEIKMFFKDSPFNIIEFRKGKQNAQ